MSEGMNLQTCAKHKRKMSFVCRNIDQCGCCFKLFCERCISVMKKNNLKKQNKENEDIVAIPIPHDFEQYEDFYNKQQELIVTNENYSLIFRDIWKQFQEYQLESKQLKKRISLDLLVSEQLINQAYQNGLILRNNSSTANDNIISELNHPKTTNIQKSKNNRIFYTDKIIQKYQNILKNMIKEDDPLLRIYKNLLSNQFNSIKGKYIQQYKFDGIQRQFPKYFVMENRFLYVYNQEQFYFSSYDLSLGVELPNKIIFPDGVKIQNKCSITPINDSLIAIHYQKLLYIINIKQPQKYHKYILKDTILSLTSFGNNNKNKMILQFRGRIELWKVTPDIIKCLKRYYHPAIQFYNNRCIIINNTKKIIWFSAFSILNIDQITGDIEHHIITREYIDFNPNCYSQNIEELINDILAQSIGRLRKYSIQSIKKINEDLILIQYQDYLEIRSTCDFKLINTIESIYCETISIIHGNILLLTKNKEKTNIQLVNLDDYSLLQIFSSKEMYTKAIYCDSKLYLFKHTYFEVSNRNSYFNTLVIDIYE